MRRRKWVYVQKPYEYSISCDKCGGKNIEWSEFEHRIWCYDCEIDTEGDGGIFNGPIPWNAAKILGLSFARLYLKEQIVKYPTFRGHKIVYSTKRPADEVEYIIRNPKDELGAYVEEKA